MPSRVQKNFKAKHIVHAKSTSSVIEDEKCIFTDPNLTSQILKPALILAKTLTSGP